MIPLPASDEEVLIEVIDPALELLPKKMTSDEARLMLLAIGRQESAFRYRIQQPNGPAHGLWQFERGGVMGVFNHSYSGYYVKNLCDELGVDYGINAIYNALPTDDILAACIARLLLYTDPKALPAIGDEDGAWDLYARRLWRPRKPDRNRWASVYPLAMDTVA